MSFVIEIVHPTKKQFKLGVVKVDRWSLGVENALTGQSSEVFLGKEYAKQLVKALKKEYEI